MDNENNMDHNRKYFMLDGCEITVSFAKKYDPDVYDKVKSILLTSGTLPQICIIPEADDTIQKSKKGA